MPYLTPDELPGDDICRPLYIPDDPTWLLLVSGALTELTKPYNWEQFGAVSVEDTVARFQLMVEQYYEEFCGDCNLPDGERIIRIGADGRYQEANGGEWQDPTGDYAVPPVPVRDEPTAEERMCLAAKNAASALEQLYEELTDYYNLEVDWKVALYSWLGSYGIIAGVAFGLLAKSIGIVFFGVFQLMYQALEFLTEDVWDSGFTEKLTCVLLDCASDDDGVVTFDYQCFMDKLAYNVNLLDPSLGELRLYAQIQYIMYFIGIDGLNALGATTAIEDTDCSFCEPDCGGLYDFTIDEQDWVADIGRGVYVAGQYWDDQFVTPNQVLTIRKACNPMTFNANGIEWVIWTSQAAFCGIYTFRQSDNTLIRTLYTNSSLNTGGTWSTRVISSAGWTETVPFYVVINCTIASGQTVRLRSVELNP